MTQTATLTVSITYLLSPAAQRAAMANRLTPVARKQTLVQEITVGQVDLCQVDAEGNLFIDLCKKYRRELFKIGWNQNAEGEMEAPDIQEDIIGQLAKVQARDQSRAAAEVEKNQAIDAWVKQHGSPEMKQQAAEGLLPRWAVVSEIAAEVYKAHGLEKPVYRLCKDREHTCSKTAVPVLPPEVYARWKRLQTRLSDLKYTVEFLMVEPCLLHEPGPATVAPKMYLATLKIKHGPFCLDIEVRL